jgi:hypothetical protein
MSDKSETTVIGSLPRSRPQRRSDKRAARPAPAQAETAQRAAQPEPKPAPRAKAKPAPEPPLEQSVPVSDESRPNCPSPLPEGAELVATVVKASFELAEIGMTVGARALRSALSSLPRP